MGDKNPKKAKKKKQSDIKPAAGTAGMAPLPEPELVKKQKKVK